jgi:hypothetical protein
MGAGLPPDVAGVVTWHAPITAVSTRAPTLNIPRQFIHE